ncbi:uncharacterized protein C16orf78 homolog [Cricetulus griseus]|uniref:Uncharacterized protein C16orf78 homolog n=1 Tax=Cricetulus griseus TaxID=10029 RepID=A0A9J7GUW1_CRIGR|nr:uncharacterized protein C16orf78 homolog [Cricetulus griseus]XP_035309841.1 uncharacterized protein C16orf78 homolog [Cricetulus griseus]
MSDSLEDLKDLMPTERKSMWRTPEERRMSDLTRVLEWLERRQGKKKRALQKKMEEKNVAEEKVGKKTSGAKKKPDKEGHRVTFSKGLTFLHPRPSTLKDARAYRAMRALSPGVLQGTPDLPAGMGCILGLEDTEHNFSADSKNQDPGVSKKSATGSSKGQGTGKRANTVSNNFNKDSYKKSGFRQPLPLLVFCLPVEVQIQGYELAYPNINANYELLEHEKEPVLQLQSHRVSMAQGSNRISERSPSTPGSRKGSESTDLDIKDVIALETNTRVSPYRRQSSIDPVLQETMFGARRVGLLRDWAGKAPDERKLKSLMEKGTEPKMEIAKMLKPEEVLSCRYLRLSKNNIKTLIKLCKDAGMDVDIHPHMVEAEIDSKKIFDHQLSTAL